MRTETGVKHYASKTDYLNQESTSVASNRAALKTPAPASAPAAKAQVSEAAKLKNVEMAPMDKGKEVGREVAKASLRAAATEGTSALSHLAGEASEVIAVGIKQLVPQLPLKEVEKTKEVSSAPRVNQIHRPAIFVMEGLSLFSGSSGGGLPELQRNLHGSELYSWRDEDKMLEEILKRPVDRPIILIGHSLGGDTAVNLSNRLNTMENGYRQVDLLVTLDSVGFDNDIIPANVKKNLNFIGDKDAFFNDGPNIARDNRFTEVVNELRSEGHRQIDEAEDIHFKIFGAISDVLGPDLMARMMEMNRMRAITGSLTDLPLR